MNDLEYKVVIQKNEEENGYWAYCPDLPGCNAIGESLPEVKMNMQEAITGYLEVLASLQKEIPSPRHDSVYVETIAVAV